MKIDIQQAVEDLRTKGYHQSFLIDNAADLERLEAELKSMKAEHYNEANLANHSVYLSDKTETRESHAMMISEGRSALPTVNHAACGLVDRLLEFHNGVLSELTGEDVPMSARSMLNFQEYHAGSKPLAEHYDGEYLKYDKINGTQFQLKEGLLPRYVMVFTIRNENVGAEVEGTVIRNVHTNEVINCQSRPGQVLIFDNLNFRHAVPELQKPRLMCGLRTFDFSPAFFVSELEIEGQEVDPQEAAEMGWKLLNDKNNPGYISLVSTDLATVRQQRYLAEEWPSHWEQIKKEGAVF